MLTSIVRNKAAQFSIAEMAIAFGVLSVGMLGPSLLLGFVFDLYVILGYGFHISTILWGIFVVWLWFAFVIVGREARASAEASTFTKMQIVVATTVILHMLLASPERQRSFFEVGIGLQAIILCFYGVYFTFAWAMRARVAWPIYATFGLMVLSMIRMR